MTGKRQEYRLDFLFGPFKEHLKFQRPTNLVPQKAVLFHIVVNHDEEKRVR